MFLKVCYLKLIGDWERKWVWYFEGLVLIKVKGYMCFEIIIERKFKVKLSWEYLKIFYFFY